MKRIFLIILILSVILGVYFYSGRNEEADKFPYTKEQLVSYFDKKGGQIIYGPEMKGPYALGTPRAFHHNQPAKGSASCSGGKIHYDIKEIEGHYISVYPLESATSFTYLAVKFRLRN